MEKIPDYRKKHAEIRNGMSAAEAKMCSEKICSYLLEADWYLKTDVIFSYCPLGKEVSLSNFHQRVWADGKVLALPRVEGDGMEFYEVRGEEELAEGSYHILEPKEGCKKVIPSDYSGRDTASTARLAVLVPGVVFDEKGNRFGHGMGYYDRYFAKYPQIRHRYGLAYEHQMEKELWVLPTDVPMTRIYTEMGCRRYTK